MEKYDIAVIGAGPAGLEAALTADAYGFSTALIDPNPAGGTCLHWGCIPTKALLASARLFSDMKRSESFGIKLNLPPVPNIEAMFNQKDDIVKQIAKGAETRIKQSRIKWLRGRAFLAGQHKIEISSENSSHEIEAAHIILATGSQPKELANAPFDHKLILSSDDLVMLKQIPKSIVIIGGGAIGVEFATFFNSFGTHVTLIEVMDRLLPLEDKDIGKRLESIFKKRGIQVELEYGVTKIQKEADLGVRVDLEGGKSFRAEMALIAIGRNRNVSNLGLEALGVRFNGSAIQTNPTFETSVPKLYAIGDITDYPQLAHAASYEAEIVVYNIKNPEQPKQINRWIIPNVVFSDPEVASIGLSIEKAVAKYEDVYEVRLPIPSNAKAWVSRATEGVAKMVVRSNNLQILGVHLLCDHASELIAPISLIIQRNGTAVDLLDGVFPHPTMSEIVRDLAKQLVYSKNRKL